jgi:hypothetical protein
MYDVFRFNSIGQGLAFIVIQSFFLAIVLIFEYRRNKLEKKQQELKDLIFEIKMLKKHE